MLNEKLQKFNLNSYIEQLTIAYPSIKAIWLFGSRINNTSEENSDWDLLVFAEPHIFNQLKQDMKFRCDKVDLLIVYDGDNFEYPWSVSSRNGNAKSGSLKDWKWKELN
ncbi:MAG: nucleotidyltransferase domain-containing protein, partial [Candidatus Omnitrophota bacterium]